MPRQICNLPELSIRICDPKCIPIIYIMKTKIIKNFIKIDVTYHPCRLICSNKNNLPELSIRNQQSAKLICNPITSYF